MLAMLDKYPHRRLDGHLILSDYLAFFKDDQ